MRRTCYTYISPYSRPSPLGSSTTTTLYSRSSVPENRVPIQPLIDTHLCFKLSNQSFTHFGFITNLILSIHQAYYNSIDITFLTPATFVVQYTLCPTLSYVTQHHCSRHSIALSVYLVIYAPELSVGCCLVVE